MLLFLLAYVTNEIYFTLFSAVLFFASSFLNTCFSVTFLSIIADIVNPKEIVRVRAFIKTSNKIITVGASAVSGILVSFFSLPVAVLIDVITFVCSALLMSMVEYHLRKDAHVVEEKTGQYEKKGKLSFFSGFMEFLNHNIIRNKLLFVFIISISLGNLVFSFVPELLPVILTDLLNQDAASLGFMKGVITMGEITGFVLIMNRLGNKISLSFIGGTLGMSLSLLLILLPFKSLLLFLIIFFCYGFFDAITSPVYSYVISTIPSPVRGRTIAIINFLILLSSPLGVSIGAFVADISPYYTVILCGIILAASAAVFSMNRETKGIVIQE